MNNHPQDSARLRSRPHWSYSQISQFLRCPLQYYFERVLRLPRTTQPSAMVLGHAVHEALALIHRSLKSGETPAPEKIQSAFLAACEAAERERPIAYKEGETLDDLRQQGLALLELYRQEEPPANILAVEEPLLVPLFTSSGECLELPLLAVLDLVTKVDEGLLVTEFKTSGRKLAQSDVESAMQATCYAHAIRERYGAPALIRYVVLVKTKKPALQQLETIRTSIDHGRIGDVVQAIEQVIAARAFYPIESPMNCSGCAYRTPCREWSGFVPAESLVTAGEKTC